MEIFVVSFLVFVGAAALLVSGQKLRKGPLPVGCTPDSGDCCMTSDGGRVCEPPVCEEGKQGAGM